MNNNGKKSSVVDIPLRAGEKDRLRVDTYTRALIDFIADSDTPMTIAIQGEWGSGKTSMMNQLQQGLCNGENARYYGIWVNTWQYALLSDEEIILSRIVNAITEKTMKAINERHPNKYNDNFNRVKDIGKALFKGVIKFGAKQVAGDVGSGIVDELTGGGEFSLTVNDLRKNLEDVIEKSIKEDSERRGFVFFIDDLDRIEPEIAVKILELLKNIFDISKCIFLLAIDYDVVVKGLKPKFGELTDKNEREFRSFFDKIIQLPFQMPVSSYDIDDFIVKILDDIDYLTEEEKRNDHFKKAISTLATYSVGRNPRALKRLSNSLSLIRIFNQLDDYREKKNDEGYEKLMNVGLICCQIAYPAIYRLLCREPNYKAWNEQTAARLKVPPLTEEEVERLRKIEAFDEQWEQVLFRACQRDAYLSNNAFRISDLLNEIAKQLPKERDLGETVDSLLALSSVTNVEASDQMRGVAGKYTGKFQVFDEFAKQLDPTGKRSDVIELIKFIHDDILETFPDTGAKLSKGRVAFYNKSKDFKGGNRIFQIAGVFEPSARERKEKERADTYWPVRLRIGKERPDEAIPAEACEHWLERDRAKYFDFNIESQDQYTDSVKQYIKRNYERATAGKNPGEN